MDTKIIHIYTTEGLKISINTSSEFDYLYWHNPVGPCVIEYLENGNITDMDWFIDNDDSFRPGYKIQSISFFNNGNVYWASYLKSINKKVLRHYDGGPASLLYTENEDDEPTCDYWLNNEMYSEKDYFNSPEYQAYLKKQAIHIFD